MGGVRQVTEVIGHDQRFVDQCRCSLVVSVLAVVDGQEAEHMSKVKSEIFSPLEGDSFLLETDCLVILSLHAEDLSPPVQHLSNKVRVGTPSCQRLTLIQIRQGSLHISCTLDKSDRPLLQMRTPT
jgi:hypothetical protein